MTLDNHILRTFFHFFSKQLVQSDFLILTVRWWCFLLAPAAMWAQSASLPKATPWPQDRTAAISLTFDDGTPSHLDIVGPILKKHHLNGTFYVVTGNETWRRRLDDWRRMAAEGNEIGSHTVHHPCLLPQIKPNSLGYTPEMMRAEVGDSAQDIIARLGVQRGLTFAYPCATMTFGPPADQVRNEVLYLGYVAEFYFAAREDHGVPVNPPELSPLTVHGLGRTVGSDFSHLLALMEPAVQTHQWGVLTFHGVGGDELAVTREAFETLASYLEEHNEIWCATFGDVVRYIQERKALEVRATEMDTRRVQFALGWPLDPKIYDLPLTLKWELPPDWTDCRAEADGRPLVPSMSTSSSLRVALVELAPRTKVLRFEAR
jgi:peptidoglycan/xylan/chitin deacetylase (PgdA/CDA1 family)